MSFDLKNPLRGTLAAAALAAAALGTTGCAVVPAGPPVAVGVGVYPTVAYARPYYGRAYYGRGYYGRPYYGRRW